MKTEVHDRITYVTEITNDDLIEYVKSLYEPIINPPKEREVCVPKGMYDLIEELRRDNYDKNINK